MDAPAQTDTRVGSALLVGFLAIVGVFLGVAALAVAWARPGGTAEAAAATRANLTLSEFAIKGDLEVPPGDVTFLVHNAGGQVHNVALTGVGTTPDLASGADATLAAGRLTAGQYELICTIPGHVEAGMRATLTVKEGAQVAGGHGGHGSMSYAQMDQAMVDTIMQFPAATKGKGNEVVTPTITADGWKEFTLTAAITEWEVEPGKVVEAWTYNGMVPGPVIKVDVGDKVRVKLVNDLPMSTDLHLHDLPGKANSMDGVAPITQPLVRPGESFVYEYLPKAPAVAMYHAHNHAQLQVINGMLGAFIVGEMPLPVGRTIGGIALPDDIRIAQEIPMVLNDAGVIGLSLNGKSFPATEPVIAKVGDWIKVHYMNEGLQIHPMHLHQFPQLVIAKDGFPLDHPYWTDTLNVAPGERYTVIAHIDSPGTWVWHCHILTHVERETGMFGMVTAVVAQGA
jgi:manganese oxidase